MQSFGFSSIFNRLEIFLALLPSMFLSCRGIHALHFASVRDTSPLYPMINRHECTNLSLRYQNRISITIATSRTSCLSWLPPYSRLRCAWSCATAAIKLFTLESSKISSYMIHYKVFLSTISQNFSHYRRISPMQSWIQQSRYKVVPPSDAFFQPNIVPWLQLVT